MAEQIPSTEAARALAQIHDRREQVVDASLVPVWYWWLIGGLMVLLAASVGSRRPLFAAIGSVVFAAGITMGTVAVVRRAIRVKVRAAPMGVRGFLLMRALRRIMLEAGAEPRR